MVSISAITNDETAEESTFDGPPFDCWLIFYARPQIPDHTAPTVVKNLGNLHTGDLFVVNLDELGTQKLVLQVEEERTGPTNNPEIHIDEGIKRTFSMSGFMRKNHRVQKVAAKEEFALYLVELQVKEQYLSRGDMWRFTRKLINTTVHLKKTLDVFGMRATVYGLWVDAAPFRVSSGYITKDTKVVFRSLSALCTIFLQMSKEMWDFDHHGDTYYEKAVDGFLFDLFTRWKNMVCQHDVTMTLFSRVFYDAKSLEDFPLSLQKDINRDNRGRFYEDFYRVIYQNERYDDWLPRLAKIKQVLVNYKEDLITYHKRRLSKAEADRMPTATISSAADGNFLETLNLSASVFERHYIDRPFDRLGQMSLVITPGAGVFEVSRALANMTKQRVLDNGIGSDLVCLGEQPLFAVPLFKFIKEDPTTADNYQIPHWMNLSYYHSSTTPSCFKRYIPRLPFDTRRIKGGRLDVKTIMNTIEEDTFVKPPHVSMEEYDNQVFRVQTKSANKDGYPARCMQNGAHPSRKRYITMGPKLTPRIEITPEPEYPEDDEPVVEKNGMKIANYRNAHGNGPRHELPHFNNNVKDDLVLSTSHAMSSSITGNPAHQNTFNESGQISITNAHSHSRLARSAQTYFLSMSASTRIVPARPKALMNPFAPASISIPMAPGRRRWAHTFPMGPNKLPWHFHHLRQTEGAPKNKIRLNLSNCAHLVLPGTSKRIVNGLISKRPKNHSKGHSDISGRHKRLISPSNFETRRETTERKESIVEDVQVSFNGVMTRKSNTDGTGRPGTFKKKKEAIIWGPTGVEPWSASMITGIDWKSLTIPASLPTTFDVVPSADEMHHDYTQNCYTLFNLLSGRHGYEPKKKKLTNGNSTSEKSIAYETDCIERQRIIFDELIDHRLSQGFQMIIEIPSHIDQKMKESIRRANYRPTEYNRLLSIGRIYHTLSLVIEETESQDSAVIYVQQYKPQYISETRPLPYKYRFQCPDSFDYDPANYSLQLENLEAFPWNLVDNVVINHGTGDHKLSDTMKYWHTRLVIMPVSKDYTIRNIESGQTKCDSRQEMSHEDFFLYVEHFVCFLFMLNKLIRIPVAGCECIHRPLDPLTGKKRTDAPKRQGKNLPKFQTFKLSSILADDSVAIKNLLNLLRDEQQGLLFVKDNVLPEYTFIAIEAIWWAIEHGEDIEDEQTGQALFEALFVKKLIWHCAQIQKNFTYGFFLYYIVTEKSSDFHLESNDYAEVEFHQTQSYIPSMDYLGFGECKPMRLLPKLIPNPQSATRTTRFNSSGVPVPPMGTAALPPPTATETPIALKRDCTVDVDPDQLSDRREWATAHYHSFYNPHCLFELEIRWLVATSCILGKLISKWSVRTGTILGSNQVAFHLVPIPCDPFAEFDALRGPIYINMNYSCIQERLASLPQQDQTNRLNIFQELIVKRYGFIVNACVSFQNENIYYVHISGGMLVYIISDVYNVHYNRPSTRAVSSSATSNGQQSPFDCGFYWCWNFCLGKRWRSVQTGEEKYQDIMLADFRAFCANDKDRLVNFWDEVNELANQKMAEQQGKISPAGDSNS